VLRKGRICANLGRLFLISEAEHGTSRTAQRTLPGQLGSRPQVERRWVGGEALRCPQVYHRQSWKACAKGRCPPPIDGPHAPRCSHPPGAGAGALCRTMPMWGSDRCLCTQSASFAAPKWARIGSGCGALRSLPVYVVLKKRSSRDRRRKTF
jgi:hypothetical protein